MFNLNENEYSFVQDSILDDVSYELDESSDVCFLCSGGVASGCNNSCNNGCDGGCSAACSNSCDCSCDDNCSSGCYGNN